MPPTPSAFTEISQLLEQLDGEHSLHILFESLPEVSLFIKDSEFRIVHCNPTFASRFHNLTREEIIGKDDYTLFPKSLADQFRKDDLKVVESGKPRLHLVELFLNQQGLPDWHITHKHPLLDKNHQVLGIMGTVQIHREPEHQHTIPPNILKTLKTIQRHHHESLKIEQLCKEAGLSLRQYDRNFKKALGLSPKQFLIRKRLQTACQLLRTTHDSIGSIALQSGFYDQSAFSQFFKKTFHISPKDYRSRYRYR